VQARVPRFADAAGRALVDSMVAVADLTRKGFAAGDLSTLMSPRTVITWAENVEIFHDPALAFRLSFVNKCDEAERTVVAEYFQRCFDRELHAPQGARARGPRPCAVTRCRRPARASSAGAAAPRVAVRRGDPRAVRRPRGCTYAAGACIAGNQALPPSRPTSIRRPSTTTSARSAAPPTASPLRLLRSDAALHSRQLPVRSRWRGMLFEMLEQIRVESLAPAHWPGARAQPPGIVTINGRSRSTRAA
jgi:hypothetical protein